MLLTATYVVVVFSIVVQGLSVGRLAQRLQQKANAAAATVASEGHSMVGSGVHG